MKVFSFFSGSGFLDLGFEQHGFDIAFVNEFNPEFMNAYRYAREHMQVPMQAPECGYYQGDINDFLNDENLQNEMLYNMRVYRERGEWVGFIGGPPCPDFSIAGKQRGRDGDNGKLSQSYVDMILRMHPDFFLFENVKGLWQTKRHRAFYEEFKASLQAAGYKTTERLTNALEFGAPQDRDRILLFGVSENLLNPNMYVGNELNNFQWDAYQLYNLNQVKNEYPWPNTEPFNANVPTNPPAGIPVQLTVEHWFIQNNVINHPNANDYFIPRAGLERMQTVEEGDVSKKSYKRIHRWRYSPTAAYGNNEVHLHPYQARRMSVAETLAIQTLPADFTLPPEMSLTNKFKTIGNGVPYILASGLAQTIRDYLNNNVLHNVNHNLNDNLIDLSNIE